MEGAEENELRLAALCKSLGHLWSENDIVEVIKDIPPSLLLKYRRYQQSAQTIALSSWCCILKQNKSLQCYGAYGKHEMTRFFATRLHNRQP